MQRPPIKAYSKKQICDLYGVSYKQFNSWFTDEQIKTIGQYKGKCYTPAQVEKIFNLIGAPEIEAPQ
jgi:predicted site-specific integrase-resolvase